jgi:hypothetical protein
VWRIYGDAADGADAISQILRERFVLKAGLIALPLFLGIIWIYLPNQISLKELYRCMN